MICRGIADNDRAVTNSDGIGFLKPIRVRGCVVGVTINGRASSLAPDPATVPYPCPTRSEINKAVAFAAWRPTVFGRWPCQRTRRLARLRR